MKTYLDLRFEAVRDQLLAGKPLEIELDGKKIVAEYADNDLQSLLKISVNGVSYSIEDTLEAKARLAAAGILGPSLRSMGDRCLQAVEARLRRERAKEVKKKIARLRERNAALWGSHAEIVWRLPESWRCAVKDSNVAHATRLLLGDHPDAAGRRFSDDVWQTAKRLAAVLAQAREQ